uniref:Uncharacterized protein TCIL3000_10_12370 n=1 Tax=Trypanosoma congolense (strain IL3000) TaxID=1068625 RepID=G0UYI8_TRYCI|nr:unnamed protein product [Trypanosoma congolense IL3000]
MSVYFVSNVTGRGTVSATQVTPHSKLPLVASVWTNPLHVLVTDLEGETVADHAMKGSAQTSTNKAVDGVSLMAWHPTQPVLIIGLQSGCLLLWTVAVSNSGKSNTVAQPPATVNAAQEEHLNDSVTACVWSESGTYLLTASAAKRVVMWTYENSAFSGDGKGSSATPSVMCSTLTPQFSVTADEVVSYAAHLPSSSWQGEPLQQQKPTSHPNDADGSEAEDRHQPVLDDEGEALFLLACTKGKTIYGVCEEQKLFPLVTMDEHPTAVLYDSAERYLVVLSSTHILNVYRISSTLTVEPGMKRKLLITPPGVANDQFMLTMQWVSPGLLVFGCGDDNVRFFDIQSDKLFVVPHPASPSAHITHVETLRKRGLLVMATAEGSVAVFQRPPVFHQPNSSLYSAMGANVFDVGFRKSSLAPQCTFEGDPEKSKKNGSTGTSAKEEWELLTVVKVEDRVERVCFCGPNHIYLTLSNGTLRILRETVRNRAWDGVAAATQISMEMAVIESVTGCQCLLKSSSKIYGLSIAFPTIGVWNGRQIDLYTVDGSTSTATLTNSIPCKSSAFTIHSCGIFYVRDSNRIVFSSFQLITIGQLAFTEAEGIPIMVDVMTDVVVALSSENTMRLATVNSNEVTPLGPPRLLPKLGDDLVLTTMKVNAEGRRVAFLARRISDHQPDTRIWVYDADTDLMSSYDFMDRMEIPHALYWNTPDPSGSTLGEPGYLLLACETHQVGKCTLPERRETKNSDAIGKVASASNSPGKQAAPQASSEAQQTREQGAKDLHNGALPDLENFADRKDKPDSDVGGGFSGVNPFAHRAHNLVTLFATNRGLVVHNSVELQSYHICLVGLTVPDFLLTSVRINGNPANPEDYMIEQKRLRDFEGLKTDKDAAVLEALMKFSYYSTIGNMDEAYRCVKTIKAATVWQSLAKMCVLSGRLDVASVCLAQMQDGVAASALRAAQEEYPDEKEVQVATLACSLGLVKECEELLRKAKRPDLITDLFIACGKFEQAQRHAREHDRIRIYPVAYKYAQFMESFSNFDAAVMWYCNAECLDTDVVRLYFQNGRLAELRRLVTPPDKKKEEGGADASGDKSTDGGGASHAEDGQAGSANGGENEKKDQEGHTQLALQKLLAHNPDLLQWWGKQAERRKMFSEAINYFSLAGDVFNVVRLLFDDSPPRVEEAVNLVEEEIRKKQSEAASSKSSSAQSSAAQTMEPVGAAFFVGKHYERNGDVSSALKYYQYAGAWRAAAKLAKTHERNSEVLTIAQNSEDTFLMLDCAAFLEQRGCYDMSVDLYHRVGDIQKAIDVCIKGKQYDAMHRISSTLNVEKDAEVFLQMASHFVENGDHTKAAEMYIFARDYPSALALCVEHGVALTDEMADAIAVEAKRRQLTDDQMKELERQIAGIARDQGNWNLACKKYTQLGERVKAMKMLMRGGDVKKVIFFANHSRSTEIFTLAGNFLQSQNWHTDANIHKHIVLFYNKAKALTNLVSYIDSYAQLQIDENRNYYDAWCALDECIRQVEGDQGALSDSVTSTSKLQSLRTRRDIVAQAVKALKLLPESGKGESQANEFIAVCSDLIKRSRPSHQDHSDITTSIRIGDIFALLVRHYQENMKSSKEAMRVIDSMVKHGVEPQFFVERDLLEAVCSSNGRKLTEFVSGSNGINDGGKEGGA